MYNLERRVPRNCHQLKWPKRPLEVGRSVNRTRVVVLVKCTSEWCTASSRAWGLLSSAATDSCATHEIGSLIVVGCSTSSGTDPPHDYSNSTDDDGTTNTHHDTDNDLLLRRRETGARVLVG